MKLKKRRFLDIKQYIDAGSYQVNVMWRYLDDHIKRTEIDIDPPYQRAHVWTDQQRTAYVEHMLKGGVSGRDIYSNCPGWMADFKGPHNVVDGKQRITTALLFLDDKVRAFKRVCSDFEGKIPTDVSFIWHVNKLETQAEVMEWYLQLNAGGTPHEIEELNRVRRLLKKERNVK